MVICAMMGRSDMRLHRAHRRAQLVHVAEGLEDEPVDAAGEESLRLAAEGLLAPPRRWSRRTARSGRPAGRWRRRRGAAARRLARQPGRGLVDPLGVVGQPVVGQLPRVGAEGVGLDDLRARLHVGPVDVADQVRLLQVQLVVADVEEGALAVEHGAHRAVDDVDPAVGEEFAEGWHSGGRAQDGRTAGVIVRIRGSGPATARRWRCPSPSGARSPRPGRGRCGRRRSTAARGCQK